LLLSFIIIVVVVVVVVRFIKKVGQVDICDEVSPIFFLL